MAHIFQRRLLDGGVPPEEIKLWDSAALLSVHEYAALAYFFKTASSQEIRDAHRLVKEKTASFASADLGRFENDIHTKKEKS